ncbi:MAG: hypothetical protein ACKVVT_05780 [Dehalococcoidia bacterium]
MSRFHSRLATVAEFLRHEEGHAAPLPGMLIAGAGMVLLGIGAANDTGWLAIAGGIGGAVGIVAAFLRQHMGVEYDIYKRLDNLEKK